MEMIADLREYRRIVSSDDGVLNEARNFQNIARAMQYMAELKVSTH